MSHTSLIELMYLKIGFLLITVMYYKRKKNKNKNNNNFTKQLLQQGPTDSFNNSTQTHFFPSQSLP